MKSDDTPSEKIPADTADQSLRPDATETQTRKQDTGLPLSRRGALASLMTIGGLSLAGSVKARHGGQHWRTDVDADGNRLIDLGALAMRDNLVAITDFSGSNLSIDGGGVLNATDTRSNVSDDGTEVLEHVVDVNFGANLDVTDDGDGSVTVDAIGTDTQTALTLPDFTTVGDDPAAVINAMQRLFNEPAWVDDLPAGWTGGNYRRKARHGEDTGPAFNGAAVLPTGEVVFAPFGSDNVGLYDPATDTYTSGPTHRESTLAFSGAALAPTGEVVFAPWNASVGIYDPATDTYTSGPSHGEGLSAFAGAALAPTGEIIFAPADSNHVGVYDPTTDTYSSGPSHGEGDQAFHGAALAPTGEIVFAPDDADHVGVYDPATKTYTTGPSHGEGNHAFHGAALAPTGEIVFAPADSDHVGVYDPATTKYTSGAIHGETRFGDAFSAAALAPTGEVVFAPSQSRHVGVYDPVTDTYTSGPIQVGPHRSFSGAVLAPTGEVVLVPTSDFVGSFVTVSGRPMPGARANAAHPLVNNS